MTVRPLRRRALTFPLAVALALGAVVAPGIPAQAATSVYASLVLGESPSAYYRLGEAPGATTMTDSSLPAYDGSYTAPVTLGQPSAVANAGDTSATFSGGKGTATGVPAPTTGYTIEAWINRADNASRVIGGQTGGGQLYIENDHLGVKQTLGPRFTDTSTLLGTGQWYHVAATWDGVTTRLYVNGNPADTTNTLNTVPTGGDFVVGHGTVGPPFPAFLGGIDEMAYYPTVLTQATLEQHWLVGQDAVAPTITITGPPDDKDTFILHTSVPTPGYSCSDPAPSSGTPTCDASSAGSGILGPRTFTVDSEDPAGNESSQTIAYTIVPNRYGDEVLLSNPLAYYRLSDPAGAVVMTDSSGNGNDGEYRNGVADKRRTAAIACERRPNRPRVCEPANDPKNYSTHFGGGGYGFVDTLEAPEDAYTLEAWIKRDNHADGSIVGHGGGGQLYVVDGRLALRQTQDDVVSADPELTPGMWWHVAATWDGSTTRLYVNGAEVATSTAALKAPSGYATFYVGLGEQAPTFRGDLDEVAYYGTALSGAVIDEHYQVGSVQDWPSLSGSNSAEPVATITTPTDGALYAPTKTPTADFSCDDPDGAGDVVSCVAEVNGNPIANGATLPDALPAYTFEVTATDTGGNTHVNTVTYEVKSFADIYNTDSPSAYYRLGDLDSVMADASGNGLDGEYKNNQESGPVGISGDLDLARRFWGESGYGYVNGIEAGRHQSTLEAWVNADDLRDQSIGGLSGTDELFVTGGKYAFRHLDRTVVSSVGPTPGSFQQVVGVWDGATIEIYVDGQPTGSAEAATGTSSGSGTFYVGFGTQGIWFLGSLDEVAYYPSALSPDRIWQHWKADPPPPTRCTVPKVRGLRLKAAKVSLVRAGCTVGTVTRIHTVKRKRGHVVRQSLSAGATRRLGRAVDLVVGRR